MDKRFCEEIFNQKRFGKLICKWILACVLFSLQGSNIPAANHFPAFSVPKCTLPHIAPPDFTVLATASYTYRPDNTAFYIEAKPNHQISHFDSPEDSWERFCFWRLLIGKIQRLPNKGVGVWLWCSRHEWFGGMCLILQFSEVSKGKE